MALAPGQVYAWADAAGKDRRYVVISSARLNRGRWVVGVPLYSTRIEERRVLPNCVLLTRARDGVAKDCVAVAEGVTTLDADELGPYPSPEAVLSDERMQEVIGAVGSMMDAQCMGV